MDKEFTILLAEDEEHDVWHVKRALNWGDIHNPVQVVRDGEEAIAYLSGLHAYADRIHYPKPNLAIVDLTMAKKDGWEVLEWVRNQADGGLKRLPIIILGSSNKQKDIDRAYEMGANAYLVKPEAFSKLVETLKTTTDFWKETAAIPQT